jgi:hypothetical protein
MEGYEFLAKHIKPQPDPDATLDDLNETVGKIDETAVLLRKALEQAPLPKPAPVTFPVAAIESITEENRAVRVKMHGGREFVFSYDEEDAGCFGSWDDNLAELLAAIDRLYDRADNETMTEADYRDIEADRKFHQLRDEGRI